METNHLKKLGIYFMAKCHIDDKMAQWHVAISKTFWPGLLEALSLIEALYFLEVLFLTWGT